MKTQTIRRLTVFSCDYLAFTALHLLFAYCYRPEAFPSTNVILYFLAVTDTFYRYRSALSPRAIMGIAAFCAAMNWAVFLLLVIFFDGPLGGIAQHFYQSLGYFAIALISLYLFNRHRLRKSATGAGASVRP